VITSIAAQLLSERRRLIGRTIAVLEGDQTRQELLDEALRVLEPSVIRVPLNFARFDLSLKKRRETDNQIVRDAAATLREHGLGIKAATITPEKAGDAGSPNVLLSEEIDGKVILRVGRTLPGIRPMGGVYALLLVKAGKTLVIPALNHDGGCLSDLVLQMFGSIAGSESLILSFDQDFNVKTVIAEAPHGTESVQEEHRESAGADSGGRGVVKRRGITRRWTRLTRDLRISIGSNLRRCSNLEFGQQRQHE